MTCQIIAMELGRKTLFILFIINNVFLLWNSKIYLLDPKDYRKGRREGQIKAIEISLNVINTYILSQWTKHSNYKARTVRIDRARPNYTLSTK